jgi:DNA-binding transcriptional ArsR family regulator
VCDLAWIVGQPDKLVSHHLRLLRDAEMAVSRRDGKMVMYALTDQARRLVMLLLEVSSPHRESPTMAGGRR